MVLLRQEINLKQLYTMYKSYAASFGELRDSDTLVPLDFTYWRHRTKHFAT
jgi:hypothetical protein